MTSRAALSCKTSVRLFNITTPHDHHSTRLFGADWGRRTHVHKVSMEKHTLASGRSWIFVSLCMYIRWQTSSMGYMRKKIYSLLTPNLFTVLDFGRIQKEYHIFSTFTYHMKMCECVQFSCASNRSPLHRHGLRTPDTCFSMRIVPGAMKWQAIFIQLYTCAIIDLV
jgi:hypothetical protein